ncbi:MAG: 30S ribosome-binding factor RbfA [Acidobacteria bacterium]|nr:30S ribosome-binding factor RbfA [Acidobacteriota bacterium]
MPSHRALRIAEAIREVVSSAILFEVSDPRVQGVTVITVEVSGDLRAASIFVSIMGSPEERDRAMAGLRSATGFLQSLVAARLQTRFTPVLSFKLDLGVKKSVEMSKLIDDTLREDREARGEVDPEPDDLDDDPDPDGPDADPNEAD